MGEVNARAQLLEVVRQVRRRWRIKLALRGAVGFLLAGLVAILAIAYTLEALKFTPAAIFWFRIVTGARAGRRRRVVLRAPAVAQGHRRTGRAVSRRARADARFDDPERDGSVASGPATGRRS